MATAGTIDFQHWGIGKTLSIHRLRVPLNQREYSWKQEHVQDLFEDLHRSIGQGAYFLGTIVLTHGHDGMLEVTDGQQRLATTTILLGAIRDAFHRVGSAIIVQSIESEFLLTIDRVAQKYVSKLTLNVDDNEFFRRSIILRPDDPDRKSVQARRDSHRLMEKAQHLAARHVDNLTKNRSEPGRTEVLNHWLDFMTRGAQVIVLTVPDHLDAFRMFETLNDRGLKTSQSDLLKNYLFGEAGPRIQEAQAKWSTMVGTLESVGLDDITVTYLRHFLVAKNGAIRERDVYDKISTDVTGPFAAIGLLDELVDNANSYVALINSTHEHWNAYGPFSSSIRKHVATLGELHVEQIRPLMLACVKTFTPKEVDRAFRMFIWWSVRFIVTGGPTGTIEKYYAGRAAEVWREEIKTAKDLALAMLRYVPDDTAFRSAFESLRVSKSYLARYLLRALERTKKGDPTPELVVNEDQSVLTLEHVLPQNPSGDWAHIERETAEVAHRRLGNMVLLRATANVTAANSGFTEKKNVYESPSALLLTKEVAGYSKWGLEEINDRQQKMAELAVKTWPPQY